MLCIWDFLKNKNKTPASFFLVYFFQAGQWQDAHVLLGKNILDGLLPALKVRVFFSGQGSCLDLDQRGDLDLASQILKGPIGTPITCHLS